MDTIVARYLTDIRHLKIGENAELYKTWWGLINQDLTAYEEAN